MDLAIILRMIFFLASATKSKTRNTSIKLKSRVVIHPSFAFKIIHSTGIWENESLEKDFNRGG